MRATMTRSLGFSSEACEILCDRRCETRLADSRAAGAALDHASVQGRESDACNADRGYFMAVTAAEETT